MSNRTKYPAQSYGSGRIYLEFELLGAGAAALTASTDTGGVVASISRSGVGINVVTLKDAFVKVVEKGAEVDDTANDGAYATVSDVTNEGTNTPLQFTIRTRSAAGALADMAAGRKVGVHMSFRDTKGWGTT
jgi:hypothetical protein